MALANSTLITVTATYTRLDGRAASGQVFFSSNQVLVNSTSGEIVPPVDFVATLDANGAISIDLPATDDEDYEPQGWTYTVTEDTDGGDRPPFGLSVPADGGSIDLADVAPPGPTESLTADEYTLLSTFTGHRDDADEHIGEGLLSIPALGDVLRHEGADGWQVYRGSAVGEALVWDGSAWVRDSDTYRVRRVEDVKANHGAVGDGSTDDTAALQSAIDTVEAAGGGIVFVPQGSYHYSTLSFATTSNAIILIGAGRRVSTLRTTTTTGTAIDCTGATSLYVADLSFSPTSERTSGALFDVTDTVDPTFERLRIASHYRGFIGTNIDNGDFAWISFHDFSSSATNRAFRIMDSAGSVSTINLTDVVAQSANKPGDFMYELVGCDTVRLTRVRAQKQSTAQFAGYRLAGVAYVFATDCVAETGDGDGYTIEGAGNYHLGGCHAVICLNGVTIKADGGGATPDYVGIAGGWYKQNDRRGIDVVAAKSFAIRGASVSNNSQESAGGYDGIFVRADNKDFAIIGNEINGGGGQQRYAINVQTGSSDRYYIYANPMTGNGGTVLDNGSGTTKTVEKPGRIDFGSKTVLIGDLDHDGPNAGFFGATPVARQTAPASLTDNSGGTKDNTVEAVSGSGADAAINNNFAELTEELNQVRQALVNLGLWA